MSKNNNIKIPSIPPSKKALSLIASYKKSTTPLNLDAELSKHPLFQYRDDDIISIIIQSLELILLPNSQSEITKKIKKMFKEHLYYMTFSEQKIKELYDLANIQDPEKTICGKRMTEPGVFFRCLDCEKSPEMSSSLCPECFDKSNHEDHRVCMVQMIGGIAATCDCGDYEFLSPKSPEAFCPKHQVKEITVKEMLEKFPTALFERYQLVFKKAFYCVNSIFEIGQRASFPSLKKKIFNLAHQSLDELVDFCQQTVEEISEAFLPVIGVALQAKYLNPYCKVWHDCEDLLADEYSNFVDVEKSHNCNCSILGNILRNSNAMGKPEQSKLEKFIMECCKVYSIKESVAVEFLKYLSFLFNHDYSDHRLKEITFTYSDFLKMDGHLFIKESLMEKLVDMKYYEIPIKIIQKAINNSDQLNNNLEMTIPFALTTLSHFFEARFKISGRVIKESNFLKDLAELLITYQKKFYYQGRIHIGSHVHESPILFLQHGLFIERLLYNGLEQATRAICDCPSQEKIEIGKPFMNFFYSEFLKLKEAEKESQISFFTSFQKSLSLFMLNYLKYSITPEGIQSFFKDFLPDVKPSELAEKSIEGTLKLIGIIRFLFIVVSTYAREVWDFYYALNFCVFENDMITLQILAPLIEPQRIFEILTKNFFAFSDHLQEFFSNPETLSLEDEHYKRKMTMLKDFLNFLIYFMNDSTALINLKLQKKEATFEQVELESHEKKTIEKLLVNMLISSRSVELKELKALLNDCFLKNNNEIDNIITTISTIDDKTHKLRLKEEYEEEYDSSVFYTLPVFQEKAENNLSTKDKKIDLVSGKINLEPPTYLKEIQQNLYQSNLPQFLSLFIRKLSKATSPIIQPALRLIYLNLEIVSEKNDGVIDENLLRQIEENYMLNEFINSLERIRKEVEFAFYKPCVEKILSLLKVLTQKINKENLEFHIDEGEVKSIVDAEEEKKRLAKERMEKKKQEFLKKQALFSNKNKEIIEENKDSSPEILQKKEGLTCQHCLETIDETKDHYGMPAALIMTNNLYDVEQEKLDQDRTIYELVEDEWWYSISSCHHYYHRACFTTKIETEDDEGRPEVFYKTREYCPLCNNFCNIFVSQNLLSTLDSISLLHQIAIITHVNWEKILKLNHLMIPPEVSELTIFLKCFSYFIESFHVHEEVKSLKRAYELFTLCCRNFHALFKNPPSFPLEEFTLLNQISLGEFRINSFLNQFYAISLMCNYSENNQPNQEESLNKLYISLLKDYIAVKIVLTMSFNQTSPLDLPGCLSNLNNDEKLKESFANELSFPIQRLLLALNAAKSINSSGLNPSSNFFQLLCQPKQGSSYLNELFKEVGFSFTFEELVNDSLDNSTRTSSDQELLNSLLGSKNNEIEVFKHKIIKRAPRFVKLPKTLAEFNNKYLKTKCLFCKDYCQFLNMSICLICGAGVCAAKCSHSSQRVLGNLNIHSMKCHMGLGYFLEIGTMAQYIISSPQNMDTEETNVYIDKFGQPAQRFLLNQEEIHHVDFNNFYLNPEFEEGLKQIINSHSMTNEFVRLVLKKNMARREGGF